MMRSLNSAVAGLRTHQTKMDVIGNNIANVNTYGFKASRVTFSDVFYQTTSGGTAPTNIQGARTGGVNPTQIGYGAQVATIDVLNGPTGAATTNRALDVYLTGEGYLTSRKGEELFYTRLGNIKFDIDGNLVDHTGNIIQGFTITPSGGEVNTVMVANPAYDPNVGKIMKALTDLDDALAKLSALPVPTSPAVADPLNPTPAESAAMATYNEAVLTREKAVASVEGYYTSVTEAARDMEPSVDTSAPPDGTPDVSLFATGQAGAAPLAALETAIKAAQASNYAAGDITAIGAQVTLLGALAYPTTTAQIPVAGAEQRDNDNNPLLWTCQATTAEEYDEGMIQGISLGDDVDVLSILTNISIDVNGRITGTLSKDYYSDKYGFQFFADETYQIGQLAMANFGNAEGLVEAGNSYMKVGPNSGAAGFVIPGSNGSGELKAGYLEMSNVDISQEFSDMITTQRGFQANTRIITVSDEMLQELVNLKR